MHNFNIKRLCTTKSSSPILWSYPFKCCHTRLAAPLVFTVHTVHFALWNITLCYHTERVELGLYVCSLVERTSWDWLAICPACLLPPREEENWRKIRSWRMRSRYILKAQQRHLAAENGVISLLCSQKSLRALAGYTSTQISQEKKIDSNGSSFTELDI